MGYQKLTLAAENYTMLSPMFSYIGGGSKKIVDLFEEKEGFNSSDTDGEADCIILWENGAYTTTYFFSSDADDAWADAGDSFDETEDAFPENLGAWFLNRGAAKVVTLAGQVPTEDVVVDIAADNYTMLANPFAAPLPVKSIVPEEGYAFTSSDTDGDADCIILWENGAYTTTYFFSSDAGDAWADAGDSFDETEDTILPGLGFWFYRRGAAMQIKIPVPYSL